MDRGKLGHDTIGVFVLLFGKFKVVFLLGDDTNEFGELGFPILQDFRGSNRIGFLGVKFDESFKLSDVLLALDRKGHDHLGIEPGFPKVPQSSFTALKAEHGRL